MVNDGPAGAPDAFHVLRAGHFTAQIKAAGAELCSLRQDGGPELIWQAGPAWPRHAPLLFPIVGRLAGDELRHRGRAYPMSQHGFARDMRFDWISREAARCSLALQDDKATRQKYPFAFRLEVTFAIDAAGLDVAFRIINPGSEALPASLGGHPAFNWPLQADLPRNDYALTFPCDEPADIRRLAGGLMRPESLPTPVDRRVLRLSDRLFADDAVIFDRITSRAVRYGSERGPSIELSWRGFRELGVWAKPESAPFVCIEPWRGYASPQGYAGEFSNKPGLMSLAPGAWEDLSYRIAVGSSD